MTEGEMIRTMAHEVAIYQNCVLEVEITDTIIRAQLIPLDYQQYDEEEENDSWED